MTTTDLRIYRDKDATGAAACAELAKRIRAAIEQRGIAHVVLTGGSMGSASVRGLRHPDSGRLDWSRVHLWWGDERFVPTGDPDRNRTQAQQALLDHVAVPASNIHAMPSSDGPDGDDLDAATLRYADELAAYAGDGERVPRFDVLMLGVGPDAHVASLFPRHRAQAVVDVPTVAIEDSPKPPPRRISLTYPALNTARRVWFVVAGEGKAGAVRAALAEDADPWETPAAGAAGTEETLWWLDEAAAARLGTED